MKPRVFITALDGSLSITGNTHILWNRATGSNSNLATSSSYVYPRNESVSSCTSGYQNPCLTDADQKRSSEMAKLFEDACRTACFSRKNDAPLPIKGRLCKMLQLGKQTKPDVNKSLEPK